MAPAKHTQPLQEGRELSLASSSSNALASSDRPIRLESALQAFRDVLTVDERERLRKEMNVSCDASQVIVFTAGLDNVDPKRRGKSIATRLHSILETIQRFSEVAGIYVSSHPEIAALVWGSVRLTFTVLANFTSFFKTFSDLLSGFDTLTPQFKEYQVLFPDSVSLRNSVYDFHSAIISCCTQIISSTRRTWSQQAWASLTSSFESDIRPRIDEIREKALLVKDQAALAKAQDDKKQRKWNSLLLRLSSYDHGSAFNQARDKIHRGTAEWIFSTSEFRDWYESADSRVLNISGKIGAGKTIITANVVSNLLQKLSPTCSVSYLFIRFDVENSQLADTILRSLIFQALTRHKMQDSLMDLLDKSASNGFGRSSLLILLGHFISLLGKTILVVDGLDQCSIQQQQALLQSFAQLMKICNGHGSVKILISARESLAKDVDRALAPAEHLRMGLADTNADLARYAEEILAERRRDGRLIVGDEAVICQILDKLRIGGEGMFLWVFLTIEDICHCPTDSDIRRTLKSLPRELSDTFDRALGRMIKSQSSSIVDLAQRTFKWLAAVRRPLTRWELGEALGVKILQKSSNKDQIINGTERIPGWCENLVQIEPGDETIRFFHHSIKTHLLDIKPQAPELGVFHIDLKAWDHQIGEVCLTYLNFSNFKGALTEFSPGTDSLQIRQIAMSNEGRNVPAAVGKQAMLNALWDIGGHKAARFLRRAFLPKNSGERIHVPKSSSKSKDGPDFSQFFSQYPFLLYSTNFWLHHTFNFDQSTTQPWNMWKAQVTKSIREDDRFWASFGQQPPGFENFDPESWLANKKNRRVYASILSESERGIDAEGVALHQALIFADFVDHKTLLTHVLAIMKDRGHVLDHGVLKLLLPTRRVFRLPLEREGYMEEEDSHLGIFSMATEFIAWGGPAWPRTPLFAWHRYCCDDTDCLRDPLHRHMVRTLSTSGYSRDDDNPWEELLAKIAIHKLTKETTDAITTWIESKRPCIHEIQTADERDILEIILTIGGPSAFEFASWVFDLHEKCVSGPRDKVRDLQTKLKRAISTHKTAMVELLTQKSVGVSAERGEHRGIDFDLLFAIVASPVLPRVLRTPAISIAIQGVIEKPPAGAHAKFEELIVEESWDVVVPLSRCGLKLVDSVLEDRAALSWFRIFDDILSCVAQPATSHCTQIWVVLHDRAKPTLELCAHHASEAKKVWQSPYPRGRNELQERIFPILQYLVEADWKPFGPCPFDIFSWRVGDDRLGYEPDNIG